MKSSIIFLFLSYNTKTLTAVMKSKISIEKECQMWLKYKCNILTKNVYLQDLSLLSPQYQQIMSLIFVHPLKDTFSDSHKVCRTENQTLLVPSLDCPSGLHWLLCQPENTSMQMRQYYLLTAFCKACAFKAYQSYHFLVCIRCENLDQGQHSLCIIYIISGQFSVNLLVDTLQNFLQSWYFYRTFSKWKYFHRILNTQKYIELCTFWMFPFQETPFFRSWILY